MTLGEGLRELLVPSLQVFCQSKLILRYVYFLKKCIEMGLKGLYFNKHVKWCTLVEGWGRWDGWVPRRWVAHWGTKSIFCFENVHRVCFWPLYSVVRVCSLALEPWTCSDPELSGRGCRELVGRGLKIRGSQAGARAFQSCSQPPHPSWPLVFHLRPQSPACHSDFSIFSFAQFQPRAPRSVANTQGGRHPGEGD